MCITLIRAQTYTVMIFMCYISALMSVSLTMYIYCAGIWEQAVLIVETLTPWLYTRCVNACGSYLHIGGERLLSQWATLQKL